MHNGYDVKELNYTEGTYSVIYSLFENVDGIHNLAINAVAYNRVDGKTYGMIRFKPQLNSPDYSLFMRFDAMAVEYLGRLDWDVAGTIDRLGTFYSFAGTRCTAVTNVQNLTVSVLPNGNVPSSSEITPLPVLGTPLSVELPSNSAP